MKCWKCGAALDLPSNGRVPFRATCDKCHSWLHCCKNCKYYKPGRPNDCMIPGTDPISDREASNLCDEYSILGTGPQKTVDPKDVARRLFKDED